MARVKNGGIYKVNFGHTIGAELTTPHYCVVIKTHDKDLVLVFPTTSKQKYDRFSCPIPEGSTCIVKHTKTLSTQRILSPLLDANGNHIIVSTVTLSNIIKMYQQYFDFISNNALKGNQYIHNQSLQKI